MDARLRLVFLLLLAAAASAPLASAQLAPGFYKTSCPDAEKIIFGVVERRLKEDRGTAPGLLRLVFHDCFANGCDASILIDPLSNQASEKEAGPNISVKGYDIIEEIKTELEKRCPNVVSCADILAVGARDAVRLAGGPAYEVPTGRRDSLVSNREDADNLPGPDIAVPKVIEEFSQKGFNIQEMVAMLAGGHTIGTCKCFFIEADAAPIDPEYKRNLSAACDGKDSAAVPMDTITPDVFDGNYFGLVMAKKMPLTIDRLIGMDPRTEPIVKAMLPKPEDFVPIFAKAMEKLSVLKVLTGKDGEIRRSCSEFNNPQATDGPSVIRISSLTPGQMQGVSQPGGRPGAAEARKVGGRADIRKANGGEGANKATVGEELRKEERGETASKVPGGGKATGNEAATKFMSGMDVNKAAENQAASKVAGGVENSKPMDNQAANKVPSGEEIKKAAGNKEAANKVTSNVGISKVAGNEVAGNVASNKEIKKDVGSQAAGQVTGTAETNKAVGTEASTMATGGIQADGNRVIGDEPASKLPGGVEAAKALGEEKMIKTRHSPKLGRDHEAANKVTGNVDISKVAGSEVAGNVASNKEIKKDVGSQAAGQATSTAEINKPVGTEASTMATGGIQADGNRVIGDEPASKLPGGEEAAKALGEEKMVKKNHSPKLRRGQEAASKVPGGEEAAKAAGDEEIKKRNSLRGGQQQ